VTTNVDDLEVDAITAPPIEASKLVDGQPDDRRPALGEIASWGRRYLRTHPLLSLDTVGGQLQLAASSTSSYVYRQVPLPGTHPSAALAAGTSYVTTIFVTIPLGVTLAIQLSVIAAQIGAISLAGAATGMFTIRQGASLLSALLLAAAVGLAVSADLGARTTREEIDAMNVMGVASICRLVVPHFAAVILIGLALTGWTCFVGFLAGYIQNGPLDRDDVLIAGSVAVGQFVQVSDYGLLDADTHAFRRCWHYALSIHGFR
jgi:phospholipid/cholesterol/gamma-HCH transport system permease protein